MHLWIQIVLGLYIYICLPVLIGYVFTRLFKVENAGLSKIYVYGYAFYFFCFYLLAVLLLYRESSFEQIYAAYKIELRCVGLIVVVLMLGLLLLEKKLYISKLRGKWVLSYGLLITLAIGISLFTIPNLQDETTELVEIMLKTNTNYGFNAYSNVEYQWVPRKYKYSPIELWYVMNAKLCGIDGSIMVKYIVPVALLTLAFGVYKMVADWLWKDNIAKGFHYSLMILALEVCVVFSKDTLLGVCLLQNPWNGQTFFFSVWIPLIIYTGLSFQEQIKKTYKWIVAIVVVLCSQFFYCNGWILASGTIGICIILEAGCAIRRKFIDKHN